MDTFAENKILQLNREFSAERKYLDRLGFFEKHFRVLFNLFSPFDPSLGFLYKEQQVPILTDIYQHDKDIYISLKKKFVVGVTPIIFDVRPVNSCRLIFNCFVIEKFTKEDEQFNALTKSINKYGHIEGKSASFLLKEADQQVTHIRQLLFKKKTTDLRTQFLKVFYEGYMDQLEDKTKTFRFKKKIIELYLYSQGILFASYHRQLQSHQLVNAENDVLTKFNENIILDWRDRVLILKDMGLLEIVAGKIQHPMEKIKKQKTWQTIGKIIGQQPAMTDRIGQYIQCIEE